MPLPCAACTTPPLFFNLEESKGKPKETQREPQANQTDTNHPGLLGPPAVPILRGRLRRLTAPQCTQDRPVVAEATLNRKSRPIDVWSKPEDSPDFKGKTNSPLDLLRPILHLTLVRLATAGPGAPTKEE